MTTMITLPGVNGRNWTCPNYITLAALADVLDCHGLRMVWHRQQRRVVVIPTVHCAVMSGQ